MLLCRPMSSSLVWYRHSTVNRISLPRWRCFIKTMSMFLHKYFRLPYLFPINKRYRDFNWFCLWSLFNRELHSKRIKYAHRFKDFKNYVLYFSTVTSIWAVLQFSYCRWKKIFRNKWLYDTLNVTIQRWKYKNVCKTKTTYSKKKYMDMADIYHHEQSKNHDITTVFNSILFFCK